MPHLAGKASNTAKLQKINLHRAVSLYEPSRYRRFEGLEFLITFQFKNKQNYCIIFGIIFRTPHRTFSIGHRSIKHFAKMSFVQNSKSKQTDGHA